jgi:hypothetical protein
MTKKLKRTEHYQSIYLDEESYKQLKEMSHINGYSFSGTMRSLIRQEYARQAHAASTEKAVA